MFDAIKSCFLLEALFQTVALGAQTREAAESQSQILMSKFQCTDNLTFSKEINVLLPTYTNVHFLKFVDNRI